MEAQRGSSLPDSAWRVGAGLPERTGPWGRDWRGERAQPSPAHPVWCLGLGEGICDLVTMGWPCTCLAHRGGGSSSFLHSLIPSPGVHSVPRTHSWNWGLGERRSLEPRPHSPALQGPPTWAAHTWAGCCITSLPGSAGLGLDSEGTADSVPPPAGSLGSQV